MVNFLSFKYVHLVNTTLNILVNTFKNNSVLKYVENLTILTCYLFLAIYE